MAAFNFPNSPSTNDIHNENGVSFKWNGTVWKKIGTVANQLTQLGVTGVSTFTGNVTTNGNITVGGAIYLPQEIAHYGDTDTNITFPSADTIAFDTGGTERLRIKSDGKVGIGTDNPTSIFDVHMSDKSGINFTNSSNNSVLDFRSNEVESCGRIRVDESSGGGYMDFYTKTTGGTITKRVSIDTNGRLLIGTTTEGHAAADNLTIADSGNCGITIRSGTSNSGNIYFSDGTSSGDEYRGYVNYNHSSNYMMLATNGSERLRILSDGKVGINCTNPGQLLEINGASNPCVLVKDTTNNCISYMYSQDSVATFGSASNHSVVFNVNNGEKLRIDSNGHMGLGITPSDVDSIGRSLNIASATGGAIYLQDTDAPTTKFAAISYNGVSAALQIHAHHGSSYIDLGTNGTERLRIDSSGAVSLRRGGISATPSLEIYGSGNAGDATADNLTIHNWGDSDGDYWQFGSNLGLNSGGNNAKPSTTLKGAAICVDGRGGRIFLKTSPSSSSTVHEAFIMNQSGYIQTPKRPYFKANLSSGTRITGGGYVTFGSVVHNNGSHYNASDGKFTAPIAGLYWFSCRINAYDRIDYKIMVNGNEVEKGQYNTDNDEVGWWSNQLTTITYMTANQYAQVYVNHLDQNTDPYTWCTFMGYLIG